MKDLIQKHKTLLAVFLVSVLVGGFLFFAVSSKVVAMINYHPIWKGDFDEVVGLMVKYYDVENQHSSTDIVSSEFFKDEDLLKGMQKEALSRMIEYKIIAMELENSSPDWMDVAQSKIETAVLKITEKEKFEEGIIAVYGMNLFDFKSKVLMPQAQFEILSEELKKQDKPYEKWIIEEKEKIKVRIFIDGLKWEEGKVVIK